VIEDAVRELLADRAELAPVRLDGRHMLERVERRRRVRTRGLLTVAAAAAAVGVLIGADALMAPRGADQRNEAAHSSATQPAPSQPPAPTPFVGPSPPPATRTVTWGPVRFDVPFFWEVNDTHETHSYPMGALVDGPFIGTLRTGPMCWSNGDGSGGCARSHGILDAHPADGVVAWINVGQVIGTSPDGGIDGTGDPGALTDGICPAGGTTFHAFRLLRGPEGRYRVVVDGCAYGPGPRTKDYLTALGELARSVRAA
jgi:hypothetical protein